MAWPYATFVTNLTGMSVTGITRVYTEPPRSLNTADLPAMWPQLPTAENSSVTLTHASGLRQSTVDLIVAVEPYQQSTNNANFSATITLLDNIETALVTNAASFGIDRWSVRQGILEVTENNSFWILAVTVEGSGT